MPDVITSFDDAPDLPHEEQRSSEIAFEGKLINVRVDTVDQPSGKEGRREIVEHPGSVVIVPVTADGKVIFIRQFRYVPGEYLLELPAGLIDEGEDPAETAARELVEECSYEPGTMRELCTVYMSPGYTEEVTRLYLAEGCTPVDADDNPDEPIQLLMVPLDEVREMIREGDPKAADAQTLLGMMWLVRLGMT